MEGGEEYTYAKLEEVLRRLEHLETVLLMYQGFPQDEEINIMKKYFSRIEELKEKRKGDLCRIQDQNTILEEKQESELEEQYKKIARLFVIFGTLGFSVVFFGFFGYHVVFVNDWIVETLQNHFAATVSLPMAALASLFVVLILRFTIGEINFEAPGFKFKGASGPIVLWVLCLLAFIVGLKLLW